MRNEEKAKEFANFYAGENDHKEPAAYSAAMAMAELKDEQSKAEKQALIDKVCEWLRMCVFDYMTDMGARGFLLNEMLHDFRKEMDDFDVDID